MINPSNMTILIQTPMLRLGVKEKGRIQFNSVYC